jgi:hypothetical protein
MPSAYEAQLFQARQFPQKFRASQCQVWIDVSRRNNSEKLALQDRRIPHTPKLTGLPFEKGVNAFRSPDLNDGLSFKHALMYP